MRFAAKSVRSPLRYPGGKGRAVKHLVPMIKAKGVKEMVAPFFGGGNIEIACALKGVRVHGYDLFRPVVTFWQSLLKDQKGLVDMVETFYPMEHKAIFKSLQRELRDGIDDPLMEAAVYYVVNRCSFSGTTLSGGYSQQAAEGRFNKASIDRLKNFKCPNLTVRWGSFEETLEVHSKDVFIYADPPYLINSQNLYGMHGDLHKDFNHVALHRMLSERNNWMLSYNNCEEVREMYKNYNFYYPDWKYGMGEDKDSKEILIVSK